MAFLKNRISFYVVSGLIILAILGLGVQLVNNPTGLFQSIAVIAIVVAVIYFIVQRVNRANPGKREHRAFAQAAKKSKKRFKNKEQGSAIQRKAKTGTLTSIKKSKRKSSTTHLTVIEGKKGKKKNRASL